VAVRDPAAGWKPLETVVPADAPAALREFVDDVVRVARRLDHDVLACEHALVVGAEQGLEPLARSLPSLSAFREALLDALFDARAQFRHEGDAGEERFWVVPELVRLFQRERKGEALGELLRESLSSPSPLIRAAVAYARGTEPDMLPPDTAAMETFRREEAAAGQPGRPDAEEDRPGARTAAASHEDAGRAAERGTPRATDRGPHERLPELPFTADLAAEASDDTALVGRDGLMEQVTRILLRMNEPSVLLVGAAGAGKSAFVRGLARAAREGRLAALQGFRFLRLKLLDLVSQGHRGQDVHGLLDQIMSAVAASQGSVLVIDDLHLLVAKQGYPMMSDLIDTVKLHISKGRVRVLLTVDAEAFATSFASDAFFSGQITVKTLPPLERDALLEILRLFAARLERHVELPIAVEALQAAVDASLAEENPDFVPPGSTIRLLDEACAMARAERASRVTAEHVQLCVAEERGTHGYVDRDRLRGIEGRLQQLVLGQDLAAVAVARRVRLAKLHLDRKPERPDGVFLFLGPSGVGKTALARGLAKALYDDESRLVRLDMSEYMEPHSVARIIGAPPGYVGYGEEGALTAPVSRLGHCVVLLDEIEKAHPRVLNLFLQVFDDGRLTDSKGRLVSFSDTVIIMTSNIGRDLYAIHEDVIGFGKRSPTEQAPLRDNVQDHLLRVLPAEFVNRIDEIVPFRVLDLDDMRHIAHHLLQLEIDRWRQRGKTLVADVDVESLLSASGYDPRLGARHLERNIERLVISLISEAAIGDDFERARELRLKVLDGTICLEIDGVPFQCVTREGMPASHAPLQLDATRRKGSAGDG